MSSLEAENVRLNTLLERAWVIIANSNNGDWHNETQDWQEAAAKWRDDYHRKAVDELK